MSLALVVQEKDLHKVVQEKDLHKRIYNITAKITQMLDGKSNIDSPLWLIRKVGHEGE